MNENFMKISSLSSELVAAYREQGFLLLPSYFSSDRMAAIRSSLPQVMQDKTERTIYEADGKTIRSIYAVHQNERIFSQLARHPMLVNAAQDILGGSVYIYQSKINWKPPFAGTTWDWHQDFTFWYLEDAMPKPRAVTIAVFLDEVNEFNGPIFVVPGSHKDGIQDYSVLLEKPTGYDLAPAWVSNLTANLKYSLDKERLSSLVKMKGLASTKGPAGSVLIFDSNIAHASPSNITPFDRTMILITYNHVDNAPPESKRRRPEFLSSSDTRPVEVDDQAAAN